MDSTKHVAAFMPLAAMSMLDFAMLAPLAAMAEAPVLAASTPVVVMAETASVTVSEAPLSALVMVPGEGSGGNMLVRLENP